MNIASPGGRVPLVVIGLDGTRFAPPTVAQAGP